MATEYTPNYNLDLYASADKPNLRDQYNAAMGKVDAQMKKTADDVTNANANVLTMQSQVSKNKEDIAALESTVETHGVQITGAQNTADDALSLAQTNESDVADTQADVTLLTSRVTAVEGTANQNKGDINGLQTTVNGLQTAVIGKAPTNHASTANTYGQGSPTAFGHLKVTDTSGTVAASAGMSASPKGVQNAIEEWLTPEIVTLGTPSSGSWNDVMLHQCFVYRKWKQLKFVFRLELEGSNNPEYVVVAKCSQLGIPNPTDFRTIDAAIHQYHAAPNGLSFVNNMTVTTDGDIRVEGWNTVSGTRVDWNSVSALQVLIDYSAW